MVRFSLGLFQKPSLRSCKAFAPAQSSKLVAPALRPYGGFWKMPDGSSAHKKKLSDLSESFVIPLGLEPRAHTLKVYCSTN
jgi:hypothetical protein